MKADTLTLKALFQKDVRYVIPTFQRPYVWNQEDQWEPLWEDVRNTAERYLDELQLADGNNPQAEEQTGSHFMGAVVLQQRPTASAEIETRDVIDGQQRLTTMQLLMDAAQEVLEELDAKAEAIRLSRLVLNAYAHGDDVFKLWPTSLDRDAFRAAMCNAITPAEFADSLIVQGHDFFRLQIREWIEAAATPAERSARIHGLETAMFGLLELVVIDLATADDAFVIFETLNARGTPLLASDLVKNYLLQTATAQGLDADALYATEWKPFDDTWWRAEQKQGRIVRPRLDIFLNYWLIMRKAAEVTSAEVFPRFKAYAEAEGKKVVEVAADLRHVGSIYRSFDDIPAFSEAGTFLYRWRAVEAGSSTPVLLWLFSQPVNVISEEDRQRCLAALESFLVRRMVCRLTTKDYNRLFLELLSRLNNAGPGEAKSTFVGYLSDQTAESRRWPSDRDVQHALLDLPLYRLLTRGRLRMVLEAVEDSLRSKFAEESHVSRGALTIEHVLPQSWQEHWPLADDATGLVAELDRERLLHSLGNLTLVNGRLNPALANGSWETKREVLGTHTVLHLNKDLLRTFGGGQWDEATIRKRGAVMADQVLRIWPTGSMAANA
jgi:hypothetical protein